MLQTFLLLTSDLGHHNGISGFGTLNIAFPYYCLEMDLRMNQTSICQSLCPILKKKEEICQSHNLICNTLLEVPLFSIY